MIDLRTLSVFAVVLLAYAGCGVVAAAIDVLMFTLRFGRAPTRRRVELYAAIFWPVWLAAVVWIFLRRELIRPLFDRETVTGDRL